MKQKQFNSKNHIWKIEFESEKEWLDFRKTKIGASDVPIIMGVAKWKLNDGRIKTPSLLWKEKLEIEEMSCDNERTRYGKKMEEPARKMYEEMRGDLFMPSCILNEKYPHLMASLDGLNISEDRAVEIKNCSAEDHATAKEGKIPAKYFPQVQTHLIVSELKEVDYFSCYKEEGIIVPVKRDEKYRDKILKETDKFWKYVETLKEPPLNEYDYRKKDLQWEIYAKELYEIQRRKKELNTKEEELKENLKSLSQDHSSYFGAYFFTRCISPGRVNYNSIPELKNINLEKYRGKPIISWRLKRKAG